MPLLSTLALITSLAVPVAAPCIADNSNVAIQGVVKEVSNRDRHTGRPYTYFIVESNETYCLFAPQFVDKRNSTPTRIIALFSDAVVDEASELRRYVGRTVIITGKLSSTNGGGPQLNYATIRKPS